MYLMPGSVRLAICTLVATQVLTDDQIVGAVKAQFPTASTSKWNVKTDREAMNNGERMSLGFIPKQVWYNKYREIKVN